jgi:hypothetical protein
VNGTSLGVQTHRLSKSDGRSQECPSSVRLAHILYCVTEDDKCLDDVERGPEKKVRQAKSMERAAGWILSVNSLVLKIYLAYQNPLQVPTAADIRYPSNVPPQPT